MTFPCVEIPRILRQQPVREPLEIFFPPSEPSALYGEIPVYMSGGYLPSALLALYTEILPLIAPSL
jgi:hypothetical protein